MRQQHNGFVLLIVLVYLQLLALLNITIIKQLTMLKKQIKMQQQQYQLRTEMRVMLKKIIDNKNTDCLQETNPVRFLQQQPLTWWQSHGCTGVSASGRYYYFITDMGRDECAGIEDQSSQLNTAHYYRVTMMLDAKQTTLAQETMILSDQVPPNCAQQVRIVQADEAVLRWL